nr:MAG TPA: hypothetical protein [Bacteriophage sp.]
MDELSSPLVSLTTGLRILLQLWRHQLFLRHCSEKWALLLVSLIMHLGALLIEQLIQLKLLICLVPVVVIHIPATMPELLVTNLLTPMARAQGKMEYSKIKLGENKYV